MGDRQDMRNFHRPGQKRAWQALLLAVTYAAAGAHAASVPAEVTARARQRGTARVLVTLATPAPSVRSSSVESRILRAAVGWHQDAVAARVGVDARRRVRRFTDMPVMAFDATPAMLARLAVDPSVAEIQPDRLLRPSLVQSVVTAGADVTTAAGFGGAGVAVAILDSGIDAAHPFFGGRVAAEACFSANGDCPGGSTAESGPGSAAPCSIANQCFHGTHVAGIAAGFDAIRHGVAPMADIIAVQVFSVFSGAADCGASGPDPCILSYNSDILAGMAWVNNLVGFTIGAVNLSLGSGAYSSQGQCDGQNGVTKNAIDILVANGINVVAAAGNAADTSAIDEPACISSAIGVAGIDDSLNVYVNSNSNWMVDIFAPAVQVQSSVPTAYISSGFRNATGTSMATPHVAGALTVLRSLLPGATAFELRTFLEDPFAPLFTDPRNGVTKPRLRVDGSARGIAPGDCFDGLDNDGDGDVDHPGDPGCVSGFAIEDPACDDGLDNDGDGAIDWDGGFGGVADAGCFAATDTTETVPPPAPSCGIGPELALLLPLLAMLRRRRS